MVDGILYCIAYYSKDWFKMNILMIIIIIIIMSFISTGWIAHLVIQTSLQCGPALYTVFTQ